MLSSMCPAIDPFAEAGGNIDPFAADLGEISFSDVVVIDAEPASSQALVTPPRRKAPVPKGRNRKELSARTPNKLQKTQKKARPTSSLVPVTPMDAGTDVATLFVSTARSASDRPSLPKRQCATVPVTLWPQYNVPGQSGRFVLVSAWEPWVTRLINALRKGSDKTYRCIAKNFSALIRTLLRSGRSHAASVLATGEDSGSSDAEVDAKEQKWKSLSLRLRDVLLLKYEVKGCVFTGINSGYRFCIS